MESLSKVALIKCLTVKLQILGFLPAPGPTVAAALFYKIHGKFILTLGIEFSRHYEERFTASFYLSKSFSWALIFRDFPRAGYQRVGNFLDAAERGLYLDAEFCEPGVTDAWWTEFTNIAVDSFVSVIKRTETRFLSQDGLIRALDSCEGLSSHIRLLKAIGDAVLSVSKEKTELQYQPKRYPKDVPEVWFLAAEFVLLEQGLAETRRDYVALLAVDAFRVCTLSPGKQSGTPINPKQTDNDHQSQITTDE